MTRGEYEVSCSTESALDFRVVQAPLRCMTSEYELNLSPVLLGHQPCIDLIFKEAVHPELL